eukprot:2078781-Prymnesium_polylepis.2
MKRSCRPRCEKRVSQMCEDAEMPSMQALDDEIPTESHVIWTQRSRARGTRVRSCRLSCFVSSVEI